VAVAGDTEVAEVNEIGFSSVRVEPVGDRFVYRARVPEVLCAGQDQEVMGSPLVLFTLGRTLLK